MFARLLLAILLIAAPLPALAQTTISFAGHDWMVRDYPGGPGPNEWSAGNVFVDDAGLHLKIQQVDGKWTAAEVVMLGEPLGFGTYSFEINGRPDKLDPNVVLGLFNYPPSADVGPDGTNEVDIEFSRWGQAKNKNVLNWTVYPPALGPNPAHREGPLVLHGGASTHTFVWSAKSVLYASYDGYLSQGEALPIAKWNTAPKSAAKHIPQVPLTVHINFWLQQGKPPTDGKPPEIVVRSFSFTPE